MSEISKVKLLFFLKQVSSVRLDPGLGLALNFDKTGKGISALL